MRGDGVNEGYRIHELMIVTGVIKPHNFRSFHVECDCGWKSRTSLLRASVDREAGNHLLSLGLPFCDNCGAAAVVSGYFGMSHYSVDFPQGIPPHLDDSGHEVSMIQWNNS